MKNILTTIKHQSFIADFGKIVVDSTERSPNLDEEINLHNVFSNVSLYTATIS